MEEKPYFIEYADEAGFYSRKELVNFLKIVVIHNKDVTSFEVIDTTKPLTYKQGLSISQAYNKSSEYREEYNKAAISREDYAVRMALTEIDLL